MARPSRTGGKTSKAKARNTNPAKGRKTAKLKRRIAPMATRAKRGPASGPSKDLKEAREQQAATAEILRSLPVRLTMNSAGHCERRQPASDGGVHRACVTLSGHLRWAGKSTAADEILKS